MIEYRHYIFDDRNIPIYRTQQRPPTFIVDATGRREEKAGKKETEVYAQHLRENTSVFASRFTTPPAASPSARAHTHRTACQYVAGSRERQKNPPERERRPPARPPARSGGGKDTRNLAHLRTMKNTKTKMKSPTGTPSAPQRLTHWPTLLLSPG